MAGFDGGGMPLLREQASRKGRKVPARGGRVKRHARRDVKKGFRRKDIGGKKFRRKRNLRGLKKVLGKRNSLGG